MSHRQTLGRSTIGRTLNPKLSQPRSVFPFSLSGLNIFAKAESSHRLGFVQCMPALWRGAQRRCNCGHPCASFLGSLKIKWRRNGIFNIIFRCDVFNISYIYIFLVILRQSWHKTHGRIQRRRHSLGPFACKPFDSLILHLANHFPLFIIISRFKIHVNLILSWPWSWRWCSWMSFFQPIKKLVGQNLNHDLWFK
jgi:hypothetical protein